jgi:hypothetical protein
VDASTSKQSVFSQSLAGIVVGDKNRCFRISDSGARAMLVRGDSQGRQGQFQGQLWGQSPGV